LLNKVIILNSLIFIHCQTKTRNCFEIGNNNCLWRRKKNNNGDLGMVEKEQWRFLGIYGEEDKKDDK